MSRCQAKNKLFLLFLVLLTSCATGKSPEQATATASDKSVTPVQFIKGPSVYASLHKMPNGAWEISGLSTSPLEGFRLNDLSLAGYGILPKRCRKVAVRKDLSTCDRLEKLPFIKLSLDAKSAALGAVMSLGVSVLAGDREYNVGIDWNAFNKAVQQALEKSGLTFKRRKEIIDRVAALDAWRPFPAMRIVKVEDRSGFLKENKINEIKEQLLNDYRYKFESNGSFYFTIDSLNGADASRILEKIDEEAQKYKARRLQKVEGFCKDNHSLNLLFSYKGRIKCLGPRGHVSERPLGGLELIVESLDVDDAFPASFRFGNKDVLVEKKGGKVLLTNMTNKFLSVHEISLYYNKHVPYQYNVQAELGGLPPQTEKDITNIFRKLASMVRPGEKPMGPFSRREAEGVHVTVGLAVSYDVDGRGGSLFERRQWSLAELIDQQVAGL